MIDAPHESEIICRNTGCTAENIDDGDLVFK